MPTEDIYRMSFEADRAIKNIDATVAKLSKMTNSIVKLIGITTNAEGKVRNFSVEMRGATVSANNFAAAVDKVNKNMGKTVHLANAKFVPGKGGVAPVDLLGRMGGKIPNIKGVMTPVTQMTKGVGFTERSKLQSWSNLPAVQQGKFGRRNPAAELLGSSAAQSIASAFSNELATGKTSKPQRWGIAGRNPNTMLKIGVPGMSDGRNVSRAGVSPFDSKLKIAFDAFSKNMFATNKGFQSLKKSIFLTQMGMLGVAFSSQALVGSFQNLLMSTVTGLADTESAMQNAVLSQVFGSNVMGTAGIDAQGLVDASLKAKGVLADLQSILVSIGAAVLSDPETVKVIKDSFTELIQKLTEPKFLQAIISIVQSVAEMLPTLANVLPPLANLIKMLGDSGLLPVIVLLITACQLLMPVLAAVQLALTGVEFVGGLLAAGAAALGVSVGALIAIIVAVIIVIDFLWNLFTHLAETGDILGSVFYAFGKTLEDIWSILSPIIDAVGGLLGFENASEGIATTVNNFIFNKPTTADEAASYSKAVKSSKNTAL